MAYRINKEDWEGAGVYHLAKMCWYSTQMGYEAFCDQDLGMHRVESIGDLRKLDVVRSVRRCSDVYGEMGSGYLWAKKVRDPSPMREQRSAPS